MEILKTSRVPPTPELPEDILRQALATEWSDIAKQQQIPPDEQLREAVQPSVEGFERRAIEEKRKAAIREASWKALKEVFATTERAPWIRGDAMREMLKLGILLPPSQAEEKALHETGKLAGPEPLTLARLVEIICSWGDAYAAQKSQIYDCYNVANEFPPGVRMAQGELTFTDHYSVYAAIEYLRKRAWLSNWSGGKAGGWTGGHGPREILEAVAVAKAEAKKAHQTFDRYAVQNAVVAAFCIADKKGSAQTSTGDERKAAAAKSRMERQAKEKQKQQEVAAVMELPTLWRVDGENEDAVFYVVDHAAKPNSVDLGRVRLKPGRYRIVPEPDENLSRADGLSVIVQT